MQTVIETQSNISVLTAKRNELHYLDQVYKYLKYLECLYKASKIKDENRAWYTMVGIKNCDSERERVKAEIQNLTKTNYEQ